MIWTSLNYVKNASCCLFEWIRSNLLHSHRLFSRCRNSSLLLVWADPWERLSSLKGSEGTIDGRFHLYFCLWRLSMLFEAVQTFMLFLYFERPKINKIPSKILFSFTQTLDLQSDFILKTNIFKSKIFYNVFPLDFHTHTHTHTLSASSIQTE